MGTAGAASRLYVERHDRDPVKLEEYPKYALHDLIRTADELVRIRARLGHSASSVTT